MTLREFIEQQAAAWAATLSPVERIREGVYDELLASGASLGEQKKHLAELVVRFMEDLEEFPE